MDRAWMRRIETLIRQLQGAIHGRMVWGLVSSAGAIANGTGYTVNKTGTGTYVVTFDRAFDATPAITATMAGAGAGSARISTLSASSFTVIMFITTTGALADLTFSFVAIG